MALVELRDYFVADLEAVDFVADGFDHACTVGAGDYAVGLGEGVAAFGDDEVAVVEGCAVDWWFVLVCIVLVACVLVGWERTLDEDICVADLRNCGILVELEAIERAGALDGPLLLC